MKKGIVLFISLFLVMISGFLVGVCCLAFQHFTSFTKKFEVEARSRYLCEAGIYRGIWLLDGSYEPDGDDIINSEIRNEIVAIDSDSAHLIINWKLDGTFDIISTAGAKTITVNYDNKKITSWN
jgi:hypothetical protein